VRVDKGFRLDGGGESLVFLVGSAGAPMLAYWGPDLGPADPIADLARLSDRAIPHGGLDEGEALNWLPEAGHGFTGHPGLIARRGETELVSQMSVRAVSLDGAAAWVRMSDELAGIEVTLGLMLDPATGVLTSRSTLRNLDPGPLAVEWLAAGAFASPHAELMLFDGRWAREFAPVRQTLATGLAVKENRTGRTSHHAPPFMIAGEPGFGEAAGETFALHLAWSGDHRMFAERLRDGRVQLQAGELLHPGEMVLGEGETYETPALYAARSAAGLNGLSDRLHPFVRETILGGRLKGRPRPVHYNTWEAVYFDHDVERLKHLADLAAEVGIERFVLDDGWFLGRNDDTTSLGDWRVDPVKYPQGLGSLIDHVRGLGMEFGLWVEPEMANARSELLSVHPDWALGIEGRRQPLGRGQYVLDLTRPEVSESVFDQIDALLAAHPIGYLKWDMNRDLTHAVSGGRAAVHRQTLAVYALVDRLRAAHPAVEIESCASGGGRADYEILRRTDRIWTSDCNDPIERAAIQRAFSIFFPPEVMGAHVGPETAHTTGRATTLKMRAFTAFLGHMGVEADLSGFSPGRRAELAEAIAQHKALRGLLHSGRTVRLVHPDPGLLAQAVVGPDQAVVVAAQVETPRTSGPAPLRLLGLDAEASWRLRQLNLPRRPPSAMKHVPALTRGETLTAGGAMLAHAGLPLPLLRAGDIAVFLLERVGP
jgi:alpha-galactosidase